jgi:GNAT superfamily N-acetyltransferase
MAIPDLRIRRGVPGDAAALTAIAVAAKRHWGYPEAWMEMWRDELAFTPESFGQWDIFCAELGTGPGAEVVGVCALSRIAGSDDVDPGAEIEGLWVLPAHMKRGIGAALMAQAAGQAQRQGICYLRIVADPHAAAFYEKLGARPVGSVTSRVAGRVLPVLRLDLGGALGDE